MPILSIGGWGADGFSQMAATREGREAFAGEVLAMMQTYGFLGVDIGESTVPNRNEADIISPHNVNSQEIIGGPRTRKPMITEVIAASKTAPAATSLAFFANGWISEVVRLTALSMAVFTASVIKTMLIATTSATQSESDNRKRNAKIHTITATTICILAFGCVKNKYLNPAKANLKDRARVLKNSAILFFR